jgi:glycosyltransferase 2 family protein
MTMPGAQAKYQPEPPTGAAGPVTTRRRRAIGGYVLKAALGIGILTFVLSRLDLDHLWRLLSRERPAYFLAATAIYVCGQLVATYRWKLLARMVGIAGDYFEFLLYFFIGAFTNLFVPGLVGGDAARSLYLGRRRHEIGKAVASVLADRGFGLLVLIWLATVCVAILGRGIFPHSITTPVYLAGGITAIFYLAMPLFLAMTRWLPRRIAATVTLLSPYLEGRVALIPALLLSLILHLIQVAAQYVLGLGLGLTIPLYLFLLCVPTTNVLASIPVTFNGLGVREGIYVVLFGMAGVGKADAAALGLLWFAISTFAGLCASAAFIAVPAPIERQPEAEISKPPGQAVG